MTIYEDIYERAINRTIEKSNASSKEEVHEKLGAEDCSIHSYFRYNLAYEICDHLASLIEDIQCGYLCGSSLTDEFRRNSDINIILHVKIHRPEIEGKIREVDENLTEIYCNALSLDVDECTSFIEITVVDDADIIRNDGISCVICSILEPPLKVWECEAHEGTDPKTPN